jgi:hypothetical protein
MACSRVNSTCYRYRVQQDFEKKLQCDAKGRLRKCELGRCCPEHASYYHMAGKAVCGLKLLFNISAHPSRLRDRGAKNETSSTQSDVELTHTHLKYRIRKCAFHNAAQKRAECALYNAAHSSAKCAL